MSEGEACEPGTFPSCRGSSWVGWPKAASSIPHQHGLESKGSWCCPLLVQPNGSSKQHLKQLAQWSYFAIFLKILLQKVYSEVFWTLKSMIFTAKTINEDTLKVRRSQQKPPETDIRTLSFGKGQGVKIHPYKVVWKNYSLFPWILMKLWT